MINQELIIPEIMFTGFPKMYRMFREVVISEKLDGTNASVYIDEELNIKAGSRTRWIPSEDDNYGFAKWVKENEQDLKLLGPGQHFGEWWGNGIQRNYGMKEKIFSLFNTYRWSDDTLRPKCCSVVPVFYEGMFDSNKTIEAIKYLKKNGSMAAPGFMNPEGVITFHTAANLGFKTTCKKDESPKSLVLNN